MSTEKKEAHEASPTKLLNSGFMGFLDPRQSPGGGAYQLLLLYNLFQGGLWSLAKLRLA